MKRLAALLIAPLVILGPACTSGTPVTKWDAIVERTHLGVSCPVGGLIDQRYGERCDRIGLAVWLKRPARMLKAWVAEQPVTMRGRSYATGRAGRPGSAATYFEGFRKPAGFNSGKLAIGTEAAVRLETVDMSDRKSATSSRIECCGGWG